VRSYGEVEADSEDDDSDEAVDEEKGEDQGRPDSARELPTEPPKNRGWRWCCARAPSSRRPTARGGGGTSTFACLFCACLACGLPVLPVALTHSLPLLLLYFWLPAATAAALLVLHWGWSAVAAWAGRRRLCHQTGGWSARSDRKQAKAQARWQSEREKRARQFGTTSALALGVLFATSTCTTYGVLLYHTGTPAVGAVGYGEVLPLEWRSHGTAAWLRCAEGKLLKEWAAVGDMLALT
jgi:hypothetical protein